VFEPELGWTGPTDDEKMDSNVRSPVRIWTEGVETKR